MASPKQVYAPYSAVSVSVPFVTNEWNECLAILLLPYIIVPYPLSWTPRVCNWVVMLIAVTVNYQAMKMLSKSNYIHCAHLFLFVLDTKLV